MPLQMTVLLECKVKWDFEQASKRDLIERAKLEFDDELLQRFNLTAKLESMLKRCSKPEIVSKIRECINQKPAIVYHYILKNFAPLRK